MVPKSGDLDKSGAGGRWKGRNNMEGRNIEERERTMGREKNGGVER